MLGWGLIGCGSVVESKSGPSIKSSARSTMVAVMRRDRSKARLFAEKNDVKVWTNDWKEIVDNRDVDIVYVATPPSSHREYVLKAAETGKHVLVEKPMGMSAAQALEMIEACENSGVELFVAYYRRFHPHVQMMSDLIQQGELNRYSHA